MLTVSGVLWDYGGRGDDVGEVAAGTTPTLRCDPPGLPRATSGSRPAGLTSGPVGTAAAHPYCTERVAGQESVSGKRSAAGYDQRIERAAPFPQFQRVRREYA